MVECLLTVEGFKILKPIYISITETPHGDYIASVPTANLNASGDDRTEAIYNLQDIVGYTYRLLKREPRLGPEAEHQKQYLESHLELNKDDEIKELKAWVADLQSGMYLNCVYCGHRYGPGVGADVLTTHVEQCPKHPLAAALRDAQELRTALAEARRDNRELSNRLHEKEDDHVDEYWA